MVAAPQFPADPLSRQDDAARRAEEALLGAILYDPACITNVKALLTPADFLLVAHAQAYRCMVGLARRGKPCDIVHVSNALDLLTDARMEAADLADLAVRVWENGNPWSVLDYAELVKDHAERRRLREQGLLLFKQSVQPDPVPHAAPPPPRYITDRPDN